MSTHKDEKNGTWYVMVRYHDWKGEKKQKCNRFPVIPLVRDKRIWELTVCPPTIAALENTKLVLYLASRRIIGLPAASPSDKQIPLTTRAEKNLLRDNYNEIALVLFPKS